MILEFIKPYAIIIYSGAWGIAQNLEGLGLFGVFNDFFMEGIPYPVFNMSPNAGVAILSVLYSLFFILVVAVNVRASFYINNRLGFLSILIWLTPGFLVLSGFGLSHYSVFIPDRFEFNEGFPGSIASAAVNLGLSIIFGWSLLLIVGSYFSKDKFKNLYDHFWYPLGLVAALYFVTDAGLRTYERDFNENHEKLSGYLSLYMKSLKNLEILCRESEIVIDNAPNLCSSVLDLQFKIQNDLNMKPTLLSHMDIPEWPKFLMHSAGNNVAKEVEFLNSWGCKQGSIADFCFRIPIEQVFNEDDLDRNYVFIPEHYSGAIMKRYEYLISIDEKISEIKQGFNVRYFAFLIVAFLAGGKVANASRSFINCDSKQKSWVASIVKFFMRIGRYTFLKIVFAFRFLALNISNFYKEWLLVKLSKLFRRMLCK